MENPKYLKNIAFIVPSLGPGGAERVVVTLANKLVGKYNVTIITLNNEETNYKIDERIVIVCVKDTRQFSSNFIKALCENFKLIIRILKITKKNQSGLIVGFTTTANVLAIITSRLRKRKSIVSERANPEVYVPNSFWKALQNYYYPKTNLLIVQSRFSKDYFSKKVSPEKIMILPNPVDQEIYKHQNLGEDRENIVLTVGRLDANKNQELLIRAFANLPENDWYLYIVGAGVLKEYYMQLVESLQIEKRVVFTGNVSKVWEYYNRAKIFAFCSNSEGFPNALLEAVTLGVPSISTNCKSGPSELIEDNVNGFLIKINDQFALEEKLKQLMFNNENYQYMLRQAGRISQEFEPEKVLIRWCKVIESTINS